MNREQCQKMCDAMNEMEVVTRELAATKKTLGTLIVWLVVELGNENVERLLAMMSSESQREADGNADESSESPAENAAALAPAGEKTPTKKTDV